MQRKFADRTFAERMWTNDSELEVLHAACIPSNGQAKADESQERHGHVVFVFIVGPQTRYFPLIDCASFALILEAVRRMPLGVLSPGDS